MYCLSLMQFLGLYAVHQKGTVLWNKVSNTPQNPEKLSERPRGGRRHPLAGTDNRVAYLYWALPSVRGWGLAEGWKLLPGTWQKCDGTISKRGNITAFLLLHHSTASTNHWHPDTKAPHLLCHSTAGRKQHPVCYSKPLGLIESPHLLHSTTLSPHASFPPHTLLRYHGIPFTISQHYAQDPPAPRESPLLFHNTEPRISAPRHLCIPSAASWYSLHKCQRTTAPLCFITE